MESSVDSCHVSFAAGSRINARSAPLNASGASTGEKCPQSSKATSRAPGMRLREGLVLRERAPFVLAADCDERRLAQLGQKLGLVATS